MKFEFTKKQVFSSICLLLVMFFGLILVDKYPQYFWSISYVTWGIVLGYGLIGLWIEANNDLNHK